MNAEIVGQFFISPNWFRTILAVVLFFYAVRLPLRPPCFVAISAIPLVFLFRDITLYFFASQIIVLTAEYIVMSIYLCWVCGYRNRREGKVYVLVVSPIMAVVTFFALLTNEAPVWDVMHTLLVLVTFIFLMQQIYNVSTKNVRDGEFVEHMRGYFSLYYVVILLMEMFVGIDSYIYSGLLLSATYLVHFTVFRMYYVQDALEKKENLQFTRSYINSVFDFIKNINEALSEHSAVQKVLDFVIASVMENTHADGGVILLYSEEDQKLRVRSISGYYPPPFRVPSIVTQKIGKIDAYFKSKALSLDGTYIGRAAREQSPLYIPHAEKSPEIRELIKDDINYCSSLILIPLAVSGRLYGVLSIVSRDPEHRFSEQDFERTQVFADYTSLTMDALYNYVELVEKREIEREVEIAGGIQRNLFPRELPSDSHVKISAQTIAARGVSGDYYDIIKLPWDNRLGILVCDVAGKGIPASLVMVMIRTILHLIAGEKNSASQFVSLINRGVAGNVGIERFATLSFLILDPYSGSAEYCNAAHHPLLLYKPSDKSFRQIDSEGVPVGIDSSWDYPQTSFQVEKEDILIFYTDGITEAMNLQDQQFGFERLKKAVVQNADLEPDGLKQGIFDAIEEFVGEASQHDDETLIIVKKN